MVRQSLDIMVIILAEGEYELFLYDDDRLAIFNPYSTSLANFIEVVQYFGKRSGCKMNWDKSSLLHLDPNISIQLCKEMDLLISLDYINEKLIKACNNKPIIL